MQSSFLSNPPESSFQPKREQTKINKGKKAMSSMDAEEESTESDSDNETTHVPGSTVESSKKKELKRFKFVTKDGEHVHLTKEQISAQKKIEEDVKAEAARREGEIKKKELIDLLGPEVVNKYYNDKLQYDRYCDKMLNKRAKSRITNCNILTRKGPITLKVYREDDTSEIITEFKASDLHLGEWRKVVTSCPNKKGKWWTSIYKQIQERMDYLRTTEAELGIDLDRPLTNKRLNSSVQYKDHPAGTVLNEPVLGLDDHARTFSSLLLAKIDKRNLNPLKQMRVIEQGENSAKRQKTSEYEAYVTGESSGQVNESEQSPSSSGNQKQVEDVDDYDFWIESYASDDDEIPTKQVSQDIMKEVSLTINEAELKKIADKMLRQRCTSGDEHQYHIDQMKNFLKSDILQHDHEAPALSLINQDLLYLKKGNPRPEKIVLSLHKFPAIIFNDVDIEERTSRWVNKCVKKFNPYARYVIKTYWELGHEHKFITEIVARRSNECIVSITESDYKNLNNNDIEDIYLLIMNGKVPDYAKTGLLWSLSVFIKSSVIWERVHDFQLGTKSYQQKVNLTAPTISFLGIEKYKMFSIIYEPVHGIIYKNSMKEKRVMRHSEIHKFCDATLNKALEGLKSYNNDVKYGYKQRDLTEDKVEYLKLFEEEIKVRLKYRNQMRRWEMYVNGRPLGPRRERPE
ncbi:hypothetical protein Tco_1213473 [Tanacetum coccineum]